MRRLDRGSYTDHVQVAQQVGLVLVHPARPGPLEFLLAEASSCDGVIEGSVVAGP